MRHALETLVSAVIIGCGATLVMDVWALAQRRLLGIASLDYALVGRWLGHMLNGVFRHSAIAQSPPVPGERAIGWVAHYAIGIAFAAVLFGVWGPEWAQRPTLIPALIVGLGSVAAPFLIMQPAMGAGIAASRTPNPWAARLRSMVTHSVFGIGLYVSGVTTQVLRSL
jgi:polyferredoxin